MSGQITLYNPAFGIFFSSTEYSENYKVTINKLIPTITLISNYSIMKHLVFLLLFSLISLNVLAQEKQVFRGGIGATLYNPGHDGESSLRMGPAVFLEYGYRFNDYLSATATFHNEYGTFVNYPSHVRYALSLRGYARPFAKTPVLHRFELGLGISEIYREISGNYGREHSFTPGIDFPFRFNLIEKNKLELSLFYDLQTDFDNKKGYNLYSSSGGLMFGVRF